MYCNSLPKDLCAVTDPGLVRKLLKTHFLVWLSVFADKSDDSVFCNAPMTYNHSRRTIIPRMTTMMMMMIAVNWIRSSDNCLQLSSAPTVV